MGFKPSSANKMTQQPSSSTLNSDHVKFFFFLWISNKDLLISKKETPKYTGSIQGVNIKYKNYINQVNPKLKKKVGFSTLRTSPIRLKCFTYKKLTSQGFLLVF